MSRITSHCVCQHSDEKEDAPSKAYSLLPNYFEKPEFNHQQQRQCLNNQGHRFSRYSECKVCKKYENIENFLSGTFRAHSCPMEDENNGCVNMFDNHINVDSQANKLQLTHDNQKKRYHNKYSQSLLKHEKLKFHDQIYLIKNSIHESESSKPEAVQKRLDASVDHNIRPFTTESTLKVIQPPYKSSQIETNIFTDSGVKKQSCGLKYIIFQKLSIMTHFLSKNKGKSPSLRTNKMQSSEENLFKEHLYTTKRSKSFHTIDHKDGGHRRSECPRDIPEKPIKQRSGKKKESELTYSSTGSVDAHAGSPITMMSNVCSNLLGGLPNSVFSNESNRANKNEWQHQYTIPDMREFTKKKNNHQHEYTINSPPLDSKQFCSPIPTYSCPNCLYPFQQSCHPGIYDPHARPHCCLQSPIPTQYPPCHCHCCNHPHVVMYPPFSQSSSVCCNQSNHAGHCLHHSAKCFHQYQHQNICQYENRARSTLCDSCQSKNKSRCQSKTPDYNRRCSEQLNQPDACHNSSNNNNRHKFKYEMKGRTSKHSLSNHSKSGDSSIPPPPPPPPSSLYSNNDITEHKTKHKKHSHNKVGKLCENCTVIIPHMTHSPDCTNNVQNIIYSHLNDTVACIVPKVDHGLLEHGPERSFSYDEHTETSTKGIKNKYHKGQMIEKSEKENDKDNFQQLYTSKRRVTDYNSQREVLDRRSADIHKENVTSYKPRFLSKTPETYKSKNERRHKKHQCHVQKMSKHRSMTTTHEYQLNDSDLFYREDSMDSPEAGSFIYHPLSPTVQRNIQTLVTKKSSSFNNHQHYNYKGIAYGKTEQIRKAFQENMLSLREVGWYWGPLSFIEAESLMENKANGTFLVRDSGHDTYFLSLTFRVRETTYHTRIEYSQGTFSFWSQPESHSATTIVEFIDKAVAHSQSGKFHYFLLTNVPGQPPMEVSLLYPLSRHQIVHSLKHLSRFVILSHIRKDHITELSVPPGLRAFLLEKQYYISNLDEFVEMTQDSHPLSYKPSTVS